MHQFERVCRCLEEGFAERLFVLVNNDDFARAHRLSGQAAQQALQRRFAADCSDYGGHVGGKDGFAVHARQSPAIADPRQEALRG